MLKQFVRLVTLLLVPTLLVAGAADGAYALFDCSMTKTLQVHCCCARQAASQAQKTD